MPHKRVMRILHAPRMVDECDAIRESIRQQLDTEELLQNHGWQRDASGRLEFMGREKPAGRTAG